jgi:sugar lactone lactonase YvrE
VLFPGRNCFRFFLIFISIFLVSCAHKSQTCSQLENDQNKNKNENVTLKAFDAPESILWHKPTQTWFVSNLGGGINLSLDHYGWISRLDADGNVIKGRWLEGLHAPTGMSYFGNQLYAVDRDGLAIIDIEKGELIKKINFPDAKFPNDPAVDSQGKVYVSDFFGNKIYRYDPKTEQIEVWLESSDLNFPNGLKIHGDSIYLATWGNIIDPATFGTDIMGSLKKIHLKTKVITNLSDEGPFGNLDGLVLVKNEKGVDAYMSDWVNGALIKKGLRSHDKSVRVLRGLKNSADIDYSPEKEMIGIPEMGGDRVLFYKVP